MDMFVFSLSWTVNGISWVTPQQVKYLSFCLILASAGVLVWKELTHESFFGLRKILCVSLHANCFEPQCGIFCKHPFDEGVTRHVHTYTGTETWA